MPNSEDIVKLKEFLDRFNHGDLESIRQNIARDFFSYSPGAGEPAATDVFYEILTDIKHAFSDFSMIAHHLRIEDEVIKGQLNLTGTQDGVLWGAPASGNTIDFTLDVAIRPVNDRFAVTLQNLAMPEALGMLRQVELIPPANQMDKPSKHPVTIPEFLLKVMFNGQVADKPCSHLDSIKMTEPTTRVCQDCVALGDNWPALRMCLTCGYVGCCDTSKNKHMKQHYQQTGHPLFRSIRYDEAWVWCYEDSAFFPSRLLDQYR